MSEPRRHLREILGDVCFSIWFCPIEEHARRAGQITVDWDANGVAHCTMPGCTFSSLTPPPLEDMPPLFHWSPVERRKQIERYGLRVMQRPVTHAGWRAPYVCLAETPSWAWALSGMQADGPGVWDLWQVNVNGKRGAVVEDFGDGHRWHEVRVHERIYKRQLWRVGSREKSA